MHRSQVSLQVLQQIVVEAASAHTVEEQVERLVCQVKEAMGVGACSLYQYLDNDVLRLVANTGFADGSVGRIALKTGEGLVGQIASDRMPLNLPVASEHPALVADLGRRYDEPQQRRCGNLRMSGRYRQ